MLMIVFHYILLSKKMNAISLININIKIIKINLLRIILDFELNQELKGDGKRRKRKVIYYFHQKINQNNQNKNNFK